MGQPKILLLSLKDLTGPGYVGRYHHLVEQLSHEFDVYLFNSSQPWKQRDRDSPEWKAADYTAEIKTGYPFPVADGYINEIINAPFNIRQVRQIVSKYNIDLIINGGHLLLGTTTPLWRQSRPVMFDLADYFPTHGNHIQVSKVPKLLQLLLGNGIKLLQNSAFKFSDVVSVNTAMLGEYVTEDAPGTEVKLFSNAVDTELFKPTDDGVREEFNIVDNYLFGFGGTINTGSFDFTGLFEGFQNVQEGLPEAKLMIIGDGPDRDDVEADAKAHGLGDSVIFTGSVSYYDLPAYYSTFDVGVIPHLDKFSNHVARDLKLFEYLACGTPTIMSPIEEILQFVFPPEEDHTFLKYVDFPEDFGEVAAAFAKHARDDEVMAAARNSVVDNYNWDAVGEQLRDYIMTELLD